MSSSPVATVNFDRRFGSLPVVKKFRKKIFSESAERDLSNGDEIRRSVFERLGHRTSRPQGNQDQLENLSTSIYVANFPSHLTVKELWKICGTAGVVVDVYIGRSRNKLGQMFAFVRYIRVSDPKILVEDLCKIRIGTLHLHANVPRYPRKPANPLRKPSTNTPRERVKSHHADTVPGPDVSYAKILKRQQPTVNVEETGQTASPSISIPSQVFIENAFPCAVIGCYKDVRAIENTRSMCHAEGFLDIEPIYLGGLWVLIDCQNTSTRDAFLAHNAFSSWFSILKPWHNDFVVTERIVWLEVEGIPLLAWGDETFRRIAAKWGELLFVDNSDGTNRCSIRMGVKTKHAALVYESTFLTVQAVEYCIRVRELSSWTPNFLEGFKDEQEDRSDGEGDTEKSVDFSNDGMCDTRQNSR
ncbi:hypothetical protein LXL04_021098 [Taraxacum kok-saghyz]